MSAPFSGGPLQQSDLLGIWQSVMDDSYTEPFVQAGDGQGLEAWNQSFAQLARVSQAVDVSMSSLYILPWSGQTNPPASGPNQATVSLTFARTKLLNQPLILAAGTWVDEVAPDWSPSGTQSVVTGLRYALSADLVFEPGESGPFTVSATAERPGYGYNNPLPGNLSLVEQPGSGYYNIDAAITNNRAGLPVSKNGIASTQLVVLDIPHVLLPTHVGQYVQITAGLNVGAIARMISYRPPNPGTNGGAVGLEMLVAVHAATFAGTFSPGELVQVGATGFAVFKHSAQVGSILKASFVLRVGSVAPGVVITGVSSGATLTVDLVYTDATTLQTTTPQFLPSTESWRVLDWVVDWGLSVANVASPSGGTAGVLDLLGKERNTPRISGETDASYRQRVATIADVVTPNAVRRRLNKLLTQGPLGLSWCLREIGTPLFPGFFWGDGQGHGDFYDYDAQVFSGAPAPGFQVGEPVTQAVNNIVATGKALVARAPAATQLVPGQAATTGIPGAAGLVGVAGLHLGSPFVAGSVVRGTHSKATTTPSSVSGGLSSANAWRIYVDYLRMRAYFVVCVQRSGYGDFGFGWGSGAPGVGALADWWDSGPNWNDFYDGAPLGSAKEYLSTFHSIVAIAAGGVTVELLPMTGPCV